ncbi:MAG: hypothetical protein SWK90_16835 [Chloroflexota bacterium]|nr:hypothetical protein [Chloroflexota bacterium]
MALPEGQQLIVTIEMPHVDEDGDLLDEDGIPIQETLADVLGFDSEDEDRLLAKGERKRQSLLAMAGTASSGLTDVSERHDYHIYVEPHEQYSIK